MSRIMIVEDDSIILSNLSQLMELSGLDVVEAPDGDAALAILESCRDVESLRPHLILSDLMMPNLNGFQLLAAVRADSVYAQTPFVLLTARSDSSDLSNAFDLGVSDYIIKPFEIDDLMAVVRKQLKLGATGANNSSGMSGELSGSDSLFS